MHHKKIQVLCPCCSSKVERKAKFADEDLCMPYHQITQDLKILTDLNTKIPALFISDKEKYKEYKSGILSTLSEKEKKEFEKFKEANSKKKRMNVKSEKLNQLIKRGLFMYMSEKKSTCFIREMILVHLVIRFELFLEAILKTIIIRVPEVMRSSKKELKISEVFQLKKSEDIKDKLISDEVKSWIGEDIDKISDTFNQKFKLNMKEDQHWKKFREAFYRRNILVHNNCYPDDTYRAKTGHKGNKRLIVSEQYLNSQFKAFEEESKKITLFLANKFKTSSAS